MKETAKLEVEQRQPYPNSVASSGSSTNTFNYEPSQIVNMLSRKLSNINEEEVSIMKLIQSCNRGLLPVISLDNPSVRKQLRVL